MRVWFVVLFLLTFAIGEAAAQAPPIQSGAPWANCYNYQQNVARTPDASPSIARCIRDGSRIEIPWQAAMGLEGRVFTVNYGQGATLVAGHTAFTAAQPDSNLDIPSGVAVVPLEIVFQPNVDAGTASHAECQVASNNVGAGTSSNASSGATPINLRSDSPNNSRSTARQAYTASGTAPTVLYELVGWGGTGIASGQWAGSLIWPSAPAPLPVIFGPASINCYWTGTTTAVSAKLDIKFVEAPSSWFQ